MSQNCKLIKAKPLEITKGKDGIVLSYEIRGEERIRMINEETFKLYMNKHFFRVHEMGIVTKYIF